ncbi:MAG: GntR family transcriptional regulator [Deltaproteobacteria bacterium]|nr:GntR family transcriptional regulator [Deltaproteobacteria bacterium]
MKEQKNLTLAAYDSIKQMMLNYDIIPGQRLVFVDLAKQLGVSRTPVNNALSILAKEGYLDFVPNQGYSVHKLTMKEAESLYEIREILETGTIEKALILMTPKMLRVLEKRKKDYERSITDRVRRQLFILDAEFHVAIIEMLGNKFLAERYRDICQRIFLRFRVEDLRIERMSEIIRQHKKLFQAVSAKDIKTAKMLIQDHNRDAKENLFAIIFQKERANEKIRVHGAA